MSGLLEKNKDVGESKDIGLKGETGNNRDCECVHERERVRVLVRVHGCASGRERARTSEIRRKSIIISISFHHKLFKTRV